MADKPRSNRRAATEARIIRAVGDMIERDGFRALGVNALAREAGVDKVLIYRYFGGLEGLYQAYAEQADFWPTLDEFIGPEPEALLGLPPARMGAEILRNMARAIQRRPQTLELLAQEMTDRNALTIALETVRERRSQELGAFLAASGVKASPDLGVAVAFLAASINYLSVRRRTIRVFGGVDIQDEATWEAFVEVAARMLEGFVEAE